MYTSLDVYNSGGSVVPNSDVYKYSDPIRPCACLSTMNISTLMTNVGHNLDKILTNFGQLLDKSE